MVKKDLPIYLRFSPYEILSRCKFSTLATRPSNVEFYLFWTRKKLPWYIILFLELVVISSSSCAAGNPPDDYHCVTHPNIIFLNITAVSLRLEPARVPLQPFRVFTKMEFLGRFPWKKTSRRKSFSFPQNFSLKTAFSTETEIPWGSGDLLNAGEPCGPATPGVQRYFVIVPWSFSGVGRRITPNFRQSHTGNDFPNLFRGSVGAEIGHGIYSFKHLSITTIDCYY